jgi:Zn-dependent protease with chaperone function
LLFSATVELCGWRASSLLIRLLSWCEKDMMNNFAKAIFLMSVLFAGSAGNSAWATQYTQIFPGASSAMRGVPMSAPTASAPVTYSESGSNATVAYNPGSGPVYQGRLRQNITLQPLQPRVVTYGAQVLQGPQAILDNIKAKSSIPATVAPTISVEKSNVLNSYTDGHSIVITSGLLDKLNTNDERAFVISHELSHVLLSHVAKTQVRRVGLSLFDAFIVRRYVGQGTPFAALSIRPMTWAYA